MATFTIKNASLVDAEQIAAIYAEAVVSDTATFDTVPLIAAEIRNKLIEIQSANHPYLVAEINGRVCGFAYASTFRSRAAFDRTLENSIYVAGEWRREGMGSALLGALIADASARGFAEMIAVIGDSMTSAVSIALHLRHGFEHAGVLKSVGYKHGRWLDCTLMQRPLGPR